MKVLVIEGDDVALKLADQSLFVGPIGLTGAKGDDGAPGKDGEPGPIGLTGPDGKDGRDGVDGPVGLTGPQGSDGAPGKDGRDGVDGPIGMTGPAGRDGVDGKDGRDGVDGKDGRDGAQGPKGDPGADAVFPTGGTKGQVLSMGADGPVWGPFPVDPVAGPGYRTRFNGINNRISTLGIRSLSDFDGSGLGDGLVIAWSDATSKFVMAAGGTGGGGGGASSMWVGSNYLLKSEAAATYQPIGNYANSVDVSSFYALKTSIPDTSTFAVSADVSSFYALKTALPVWFANSGVPADSLGKNGDFYLNTFNGDVYEKETSTWL